MYTKWKYVQLRKGFASIWNKIQSINQSINQYALLVNMQGTYIATTHRSRKKERKKVKGLISYVLWQNKCTKINFFIFFIFLNNIDTFAGSSTLKFIVMPGTLGRPSIEFGIKLFNQGNKGHSSLFENYIFATIILIP